MRITESKFCLGVIWLALATSSIVHIEPAPTDMLIMASLGLFFLLGMRMPQGFGLAGLLLGIFLVSNVIAAALSPEPGTTIRYMSVRFYMIGACLLFTSLIYQNPKRVMPVIWSGYIIACLIAIMAGSAAYYGLLPGDQLIENERVRAYFKDPNVYGPFLVPVAVYAMARLETATTAQSFLYTLIFGISTIGILLGFSRGAYINFVAAIGIYLIIRLYTQRIPALKQRVLRMTAFMLLIGLVGVAGLASTDRIQDMLDKRMKVVQYYDTGEGGRMTRQLEVVTSIAVKPFGIGPGESIKEYNFGTGPHNLYLHVMVESGWVGGFAFFAFLFITLWRAARYIRRSAQIDGPYIAVFAAVLGVLIQSLFIDSTHWRHLFLLFAMLWGPLLYWESQVSRALESRRTPITPAAARSA